MISTLEELKQANQILEESQSELQQEKVPFDEQMEIGAMIKIPSAALMADILAKEVQFFSIGTNDLIQYSLAVDRVNEKIAYLYQPTHPAILRLIKEVIECAHARGIWVGVCGEMSGDPVLAVLLIGMGIDHLSTSALVLPRVKKAIRSVTLKQARDIAEGARQFSTSEEIRQYTEEKLRETVPEIF
jgi:phosphotransferase system enzyme I (PtsI)